MGIPISAVLLIRNSIEREGLRCILAGGGLDVLQSASDIDRVNTDIDRPGLLIVIDSTVLGASPGDHIHDLRNCFGGARVIVLSEVFDGIMMRRAFAAGADAYILKAVPYGSLLAMLKLVSLGEKVVPFEVIDMLPPGDPADVAEPDTRLIELQPLSDSETRILDCLIQGHPNKMIARELGISESAVKVRVKALFRKLRVHNRTQAAMLGRDGGIGRAAIVATPVDTVRGEA